MGTPMNLKLMLISSFIWQVWYVLQVDLFEFDAVYLGKLSHAVVGHDGDGPGEGWFLEKIVVHEGEQKDTQWMFPCKK